MSSWMRANRWALMTLPIAITAFVLAVWLIAIRPTIVQTGGTATRVNISDTFKLEETTVTDMSVSFQRPATDEPMIGVEVVLIAVDADAPEDATYNCHVELRHDQDPTLVFRPTSMELGLTGEASFTSNCVGSPSEQSDEYLVFLIPEGLTGNFTLIFLDPDQPVEVEFSR
ncbi:hypothetical protein [Microbacterium sp. NC79]|uniref:hypothetical protein n=1 Tax=Microbacterium sp. NC79 TaxID=2851009 RepID=UPI001C2B996B|nr:hypothetical protein [Microbacterium sp. NC79]MBV0895503.1 hypothetical protein [Microbacterium sp. NC79]